jgi:hypothetical protein
MIYPYIKRTNQSLAELTMMLPGRENYPFPIIDSGDQVCFCIQGCIDAEVRRIGKELVYWDLIMDEIDKIKERINK